MNDRSLVTTKAWPQEDDLNFAVDRTTITSLEKLQDVWTAAENLHARHFFKSHCASTAGAEISSEAQAKTPKSFSFRMSRVITQAGSACSQVG